MWIYKVNLILLNLGCILYEVMIFIFGVIAMYGWMDMGDIFNYCKNVSNVLFHTFQLPLYLLLCINGKISTFSGIGSIPFLPLG